jgi:hypothetical protein
MSFGLGIGLGIANCACNGGGGGGVGPGVYAIVIDTAGPAFAVPANFTGETSVDLSITMKKDVLDARARLLFGSDPSIYYACYYRDGASASSSSGTPSLTVDDIPIPSNSANDLHDAIDDGVFHEIKYTGYSPSNWGPVMNINYSFDQALVAISLIQIGSSVDVWAIKSGETAIGASSAATENCLWDNINKNYVNNSGSGTVGILEL